MRAQRFYICALLISIGLPFSVGCSGDAATPPDSSVPEATSAKATGEGIRRGATRPSEPERPIVVITTTLGEIKVRLDPQKAPLTVQNFLDYVDRQHYDGTIFHQVVADYIILGGGFTPELEAKPTLPPIRNEAHNGLTNRRGTIAMARQFDGIDSSTCQFFVNLSDNPFLDYQSDSAEEYGYCVFGEVVEGMEIIDRVAEQKVADQGDFELIPVEPVVIRTARRAR